MAPPRKKDKKPKTEAIKVPPARRAGDTDPPKVTERPIPALRHVRAEPAHVKSEDAPAAAEEDQVVIILQDAEGFAEAPAVLSPAAYALASLFDGKRTAAEVIETFEERYNQKLTAADVNGLADELDKALFLESPRYEYRVRQAILRYLGAQVRPPAHSGQAYPADADELRKTVEGFFMLPEGPGALPEVKPAAADTLRGIVLPHIDLRVGGATYAHGYKALVEQSQADLFVILGVAHQGPGDGLFNVSAKDYATPLGPVKTARGLAQRLQQAVGVEPSIAEYTHKAEHSVEFQAVLLTAMVGERAGREFEIVPVLCGPVEPFLEAEKNPAQDAGFCRFVEALRGELDKSNRRWCVMASVDLSHVGPKFGHSTAMTDRLLLPVERADRRMLSKMESRDSDAFYFDIARTKNSRHVDAVMAVLALLALGQDVFKSGKLLHYGKMLEAPTKSAVTFASLGFSTLPNGA